MGGRTWSRPASDGTLLDLGGQWIGPTQRRVLALVEELASQTFKTYDTGKNIEYRRASASPTPAQSRPTILLSPRTWSRRCWR